MNQITSVFPSNPSNPIAVGTSCILLIVVTLVVFFLVTLKKSMKMLKTKGAKNKVLGSLLIIASLIGPLLLFVIIWMIVFKITGLSPSAWDDTLSGKVKKWLFFLLAGYLAKLIYDKISGTGGTIQPL